VQFRPDDGAFADRSTYTFDRPGRTSPAANTPRTLVSSGNGRPDPSFDRPSLKGTSDPVGRKFLSNANPADEQEHVADRSFRSLAGQIVAPEYAFQLPFPATIKRDHLRVGQDLDIVDAGCWCLSRVSNKVYRTT
jgi:hypothetical protein